MAHAPYNDHFNEGDYTPRSPNLTAQFDHYEPEPLHPQHQLFRGSISLTSPFSPTGGASDAFARASSSHNPHHSHNHPQMVKRDPEEEEYGAKRGRGRGKKAKQEEEEDEEETHEGGGGGIEVKTKFPVARIKRIMQADEDVGKVAQVTPVVVSKALELFMISLITRSAAEAKTRSSKRVLPAHLKAAVMADEQFDFLNEIVAKVPDAPPPGQKGMQTEGDSDEPEGRTGKRRGRRRKAEAEY